MTTRYFNWKLATVFVVGISVFFGAAYALNRWQVNTRAVQALPLGEEAYARQDYDEAAIQLGKYIAVNMDDVEVLLKYGDAQLKRRGGGADCGTVPGDDRGSGSAAHARGRPVATA
jgi:hypothetical protein